MTVGRRAGPVVRRSAARFDVEYVDPDRGRERRTLAAHTFERLLAGIRLRSATGRVTVIEPIIESGLRRDVVYADHRDLVEEFPGVTAQRAGPTALQDLAGDNARLRQQLTQTREQLARE